MSARTILVWGANGTSGVAALKCFLEEPSSEVERVIAISKGSTQPSIHDKRCHFLNIDIISSSSEEIIEGLREVGGEKVDTALFYAYIEKSDMRELTDVNVELLRKALEATVGVAKDQLHHFHLQTGYSWYRLARANLTKISMQPLEEDGPRLETPTFFYYPQHDLLVEEAKKNNFVWTESRPNSIIGTWKGSYVNLARSLSLYFAAYKAKGDKEVPYPGNNLTWDQIDIDMSSSPNNAAFQKYITDPKNEMMCANQAFNVHDQIGKKCGQIVQEFGKELGLHVKPPIKQAQVNDKIPALSIDLVQWASDPSTRTDWQKAVQDYGGEANALEKHGSFPYTNFIVGNTCPQKGSLEKAHKAGWNTKFDTIRDGFLVAYRELEEMNAIPKV